MVFKIRLFRRSEKVENADSASSKKSSKTFKESSKSSKKKSSSKSSKKETKAPKPVEKENVAPKPVKKEKEQPKYFATKKKLPELYQGRKWSTSDPIPYKPISCEDVSFKHVSNVVESWEVIRRIPNFESVAGELLLRKMFEIDEAFRVQFGFNKDTDANDPAIYQDKKFVMHGVALVIAVDKAIDFLGPDLEPLEMELEELGRRHIHMGAKPEYWPLVGDALFHTLGAALGEKFDSKLQKSWTVVYHFLAYYMIRGLLAELSERS